MATGFVQRFKGKINLDPKGFFIGGFPFSGKTAIQNTLSTTSASNIVTPTGVTQIGASSVSFIYYMAKPPYAFADKLIIADPVSSGLLIAASTDGSVTFNNSTLNFLKVTSRTLIYLTALSTGSWAVSAVGSTMAASTPVLSTSS